MYKIEDIRNMFVEQYEKMNIRNPQAEEKYQVVELQAIQFEADEDYILREPDEKYIERELKWYESQSLNINDLEGKIPKAWKDTANPLGYVNSNYGWCIFSKDNGKQYKNCLKTLLNDHTTRQAVMIYTRPSMYADSIENGKHDFMCTHYVHCFLNEIQHPDNNVEVYELKYIVYQRSCDAVFGFNNDLAWHKYVYDKLYNDLIEAGIPMSEHKPNINYNCGSLHVYSKHWKFLKNKK